MLSIRDSEDVVSDHLEEKCVDLPKESNLEAAEVEVTQEERTVSSNLSKTEKINVSELFSYLYFAN